MPGVKYPPEMEIFCRTKGLTRTLPEIAEAVRLRYGYQMSEVALKCYLNRRGDPVSEAAAAAQVARQHSVFPPAPSRPGHMDT